MNTPLQILKTLRSSQDLFLFRITRLLSDEMLWEIARADYGMGAETCFVQLQQIRETKQMPETLDFELQEVLELTRWTEPENREEHVRRAFACASLLIARPTINVIDETATLASFIESVLALEPDYYCAALQLINWRMLHDFLLELSCMNEAEGEDEDDVVLDSFFIYAWLLLMVLNQESESSMAVALAWLLKKESGNYVRSMNESTQDDTFLLGTTFFNERHHAWKSVTVQILSQTAFITDERMKEVISQIRKAIVNGKPLDPAVKF